VRYDSSTAAITVDLRLATGQVQDGMGGVDMLIGIEAVSGSDFNDSMIGSDTNNTGFGNEEWFRGSEGNDTINGGGGFDIAGYTDNPTNGVVVNLATGVAQDGWGGSDTLSNIEGVEGSWKDDRITGSSADNSLDGRVGNDTLDGGAGTDTARYNRASGEVQVNLTLGTATGAEGNDTLISIENVLGSVYGDRLTGNAGANTLEGLAGNDTLSWGAGNDTLSGGDGTDTAVFSGNRASYTISKTSTGFTISSTAEGVDTLADIERFTFADAASRLDINGTAGQAYRVYQAAFNRTPDNGGLKYWIGLMDGGYSLAGVASGFIASAEFKTLYGANPTNELFVSKLYDNVLHRAPDIGGYNYWVGLLNNNQIDSISTLINFSESTENQAGVMGVIQNGITLFN
jgi:Ca2+-binding RTX toxin-like protein